jgi:predicted ATP-grasp superfamily ATP-dependent carboligase
VLSVKLFLVAISEIGNGIEEPIKILGYADDWILLTSHEHARMSENRIHKAIQKITKWADNTGFQISIEKTKSMLFSQKKLHISKQTKMKSMDER